MTGSNSAPSRVLAAKGLALGLALMSLLTGGGRAFAQSYPNKTIEIITTQAGTAIDTVGRLIAQDMSSAWGQPVIVDDRPGGDSSVAALAVAHAKPDGYTLLLYSNGLWVSPLLERKPNYDPVKDFAPLSLVFTQPFVLVVNPSVPARSVSQLIALAKSEPGKLNYGFGNLGGGSYLAMELFKSMAGINITPVPYKSQAIALNGVLGNEIQVEFADPVAAVGPIKSGGVIALATSGTRPYSAMPNLPTVAAAGLPGYDADLTAAIFAPANTPPAIIAKLNQQIVKSLGAPAMRQKLAPLGMDVVASSPDELKAAIAADTARYGPLIKKLGIVQN